MPLFVATFKKFDKGGGGLFPVMNFNLNYSSLRNACQFPLLIPLQLKYLAFAKNCLCHQK